MPNNLYVTVSLAKSQICLFIAPWTVICYMSMGLGIVAWCIVCLIWAEDRLLLSPFLSLILPRRLDQEAHALQLGSLPRLPVPRAFGRICSLRVVPQEVQDEDRFVTTDAAEPDGQGYVGKDKLIGFLLET